MISTKFKPGERVYYIYDNRRIYGRVVDKTHKMGAGGIVGEQEREWNDSDPRVWATWAENSWASFMAEQAVYRDECPESQHDYVPIEACGFVYQICRKCQKQQEEVA